MPHQRPKTPFRNLDGSGPNELAAVLKWALFDKLAGRRRSSPEKAEVPFQRADAKALARPPAKGEPARLTWLGHASWLVQLDGVSLLIDPVLFDSIPGFIRRNVALPLLPAELPRIDATLVTHSHYDHLDLPSVKAARARVIAGTGLREVVTGSAPACAELHWWDTTYAGDVRVTFVPAQHWSRRGLNDTNQTLWGGFVLEGTTASIYHSGDTAWFKGFTEIGRRFPGLSAALLPIGAYDPAWFMERQHMNPEQAVQAFVDLKAQQFFAMHWGTFKLTDEPLDEPPQRLEAEWTKRGLEPSRRQVLAVGQSVTLPLQQAR
jgi:L-ascorbate metabolism protein UlaG (beta-lactamase superfamily)